MKILIFIFIMGIVFGFFASVFERPIRKLMALVKDVCSPSSNKGAK